MTVMPQAASSSSSPRTGIVVVAAGSGTRLAAGIPKAFADVGGRPMLEVALRQFIGMPGRLAIAIVAPATHLEEAERCSRAVFGADSVAVSAAVVAGASARQGSVAAGLAALPEECDVVLVHDAARALAPRSLAERVAGAVRATGEGIVPVLPVVDTIKRLDGNTVQATLDRASLGAAQTPQGFPAAALRRAYAAVQAEFTDDAALVSSAGNRVATVEGDPLAFKITDPDDLDRAVRIASGHGAREPLTPDALGGSGAERTQRVGIGTDAHAFDDAVPLRLACLDWPGERGLAGHSDGDAVAHAICDALLSAAGLGDLGVVFGTDDPRLANAAGDVFLAHTRELLEAAETRICSVAVQFVADRPRFAARRDEARDALEAILGAPVSISATTSDGLGFTGRREGLLATAVALVDVPKTAKARGESSRRS